MVGPQLTEADLPPTTTYRSHAGGASVTVSFTRAFYHEWSHEGGRGAAGGADADAANTNGRPCTIALAHNAGLCE